MKPFFYAFIFISGACAMLVEIAGSRSLYPYLGNTIYTWTGAIAVVLGALSLGYWVGGRLADKGTGARHLSHIFFMAGILTLLIPFLVALVGPLFLVLPIAVASIFAPLLLAPASFFYGMVSPYSIKMTSERGREGSGAGTIFAVSTFGSIAGVALTGFVLIPNMQLSHVYAAGSLLMVVASFLLFMDRKRMIDCFVYSVFLICVLAFNPGNPHFAQTVFQGSSQYSLITVRDGMFDGSPRRLLLLDNVYSSAYPPFNYDLVTAKSFELESSPSEALVLGVAGGTQVEQLKEHYPSVHVDAVDIDPMAIDAGTRFMSLKLDNRTSVIIEDARRFVSKEGKKYDLVMLDAFKANSPPPHLVTLEFVRELKKRMSTDGAVAVNLIGKLESGGYVQKLFDTYSIAFRHVYVFPSAAEGKYQNIIFIATDKDDLAFEARHMNETYPMTALGSPFTDDMNSVDILTG